jgi:hypothetical protein
MDGAPQIVVRIDVGELRRVDQAVQNGRDLGAALGARAVMILTAENEPQLILPISRFAPAFTTHGILPRGRRPMFSTKSSAAVFRFSVKTTLEACC